MSQRKYKKRKSVNNGIFYFTHCSCCGELKQIEGNDSVALNVAFNNNDLIMMSGNDVELIKRSLEKNGANI
jgi:hypothetical protein